MSPISRCPQCKGTVQGPVCFCQRHAGLKSQKADPQSGSGQVGSSGKSRMVKRAAANKSKKQDVLKKIQDKGIAKKTSSSTSTKAQKRPKRASGKSGPCTKDVSICIGCGRPKGLRHLCRGKAKRADKEKDNKKPGILKKIQNKAISKTCNQLARRRSRQRQEREKRKAQWPFFCRRCGQRLGCRHRCRGEHNMGGNEKGAKGKNMKK